MTLSVAVLKERTEGERRVALDPANAGRLAGKGVEVLVEQGAGLAAGFEDSQYDSVQIVSNRRELASRADVCLWVQIPDEETLGNLKSGAVGMGLVFAHRNPGAIDVLTAREVSSFAMELVPRITRAQSMDVLSSQATIAGYEAVLRGASLAPRLFPMLTTAAGTGLAPHGASSLPDIDRTTL